MTASTQSGSGGALPLSLLAASLALACRSSSHEPSRGSAPASGAPQSSSAAPTVAEQPALDAVRERAGPPPSAPNRTVSTVLEPALGAPGSRTSLQEDMGRGFQGTLALRLHQASSEHDLRYQALGNTARLQLDALEQPAAEKAPFHFDALIWDQSLSVIDHEQRSVRTLPLAEIQTTPARGEASIEKTGERVSIQGVFCERYDVREGPLRIDACVSALPSAFDVGKFETLSGLDVPPWIEQLLLDKLVPLRAVARDAGGQQRYSIELIEYSPGPVDASLLKLPSNYRALGRQAKEKP